MVFLDHQHPQLERNKKKSCMGKMGISRGKSPVQLFACSSSVFAIAICLFVSTEMASAWINKCLPGDLFIDSNQIVSPASCDSGYCTNWCQNLCSGMGTFAAQDRCRITQGVTSCKCCCKRPGTYLPPDESTDWGGLRPGQNNNCSSGQTFLTFRRTDGIDCMRQSICDGECNKLGLLSKRTECVASSNDLPNNVYFWWEQCCCAPPPPSCPLPPPPSPPPPPPSPPPPPPSPPPPSPPPPPHPKLVEIGIGGTTITIP